MLLSDQFGEDEDVDDVRQFTRHAPKSKSSTKSDNENQRNAGGKAATTTASTLSTTTDDDDDNDDDTDEDYEDYDDEAEDDDDSAVADVSKGISSVVLNPSLFASGDADLGDLNFSDDEK